MSACGRHLGVALALLVLPAATAAYQADLVPTNNRAEAQEIEGTVSISGADGLVRVKIANVNDARGDPLDSDRLTVRLRARVNGVRRRVTIPLTVDGGDGEASESLGLQADDRIIVQDIRVRGPDHRPVAQAGAVTVDTGAAPEPPPAPSDCPAVLDSCQSDLLDCNQELDDCESN